MPIDVADESSNPAAGAVHHLPFRCMFARNLTKQNRDVAVLYSHYLIECAPVVRVLVLVVSRVHYGLVPKTREDASHGWLAHFAPKGLRIDAKGFHDGLGGL